MRVIREREGRRLEGRRSTGHGWWWEVESGMIVGERAECVGKRKEIGAECIDFISYNLSIMKHTDVCDFRN